MRNCWLWKAALAKARYVRRQTSAVVLDFRRAGIVIGIVLSGCMRWSNPGPGHIRAIDTASITAPPDLVAVVPFTLYHGFILFEAASDGRTGTYVFDTGSPVIMLNREYLQPGTAAGQFPPIDTVSSAFHALYPRPFNALRNGGQTAVALRTLRVGAIVQPLPATDVGTPMPMVPSNAILMNDGRFDQMGRPVLGFFGINAMEPFETIVDYPRRRLIFIRLDSAGRRMADVSAYVPAARVPLVPVAAWGAPAGQYWWGVMGNLTGPPGTAPDTLQIDTGDPDNSLVDRTRTRIASRVTPTTPLEPLPGLTSAQMPVRVTLDHLTVGGRVVDSLPLSLNTSDCDMLGYSYLSRLGVVGFNFRTRQFLWYR